MYEICKYCTKYRNYTLYNYHVSGYECYPIAVSACVSWRSAEWTFVETGQVDYPPVVDIAYAVLRHSASYSPVGVAKYRESELCSRVTRLTMYSEVRQFDSQPGPPTGLCLVVPCRLTPTFPQLSATPSVRPSVLFSNKLRSGVFSTPASISRVLTQAVRQILKYFMISPSLSSRWRNSSF
jgi:hypothetical protein